MSRILAVIMGALFIGTIVIAFSTSAAAFGGHGGWGGYRGGYGSGYGSGIIIGGGPVVTGDCYSVKQYYYDRYGRLRYHWVKVCN